MSEVDLPVAGEFNDFFGALCLKITEHWVVWAIPMIYNDRVAISRHEEWRTGWSAAWCFDKGGAAYLAGMVWDPETELEPVGYKKVAADARGGALR